MPDLDVFKFTEKPTDKICKCGKPIMSYNRHTPSECKECIIKQDDIEYMAKRNEFGRIQAEFQERKEAEKVDKAAEKFNNQNSYKSKQYAN